MSSWPRRSKTLLVALAISLAAPWGLVAAQTDEMPGVRGTLYESPSFGWILIADEPPWTFAEATSDGLYDIVRLVADAGDGSEDVFISYADDGRGPEGCVQDLVDSLAAAYEGYPLQGWSEPEVELRPSLNEDEASAYARVVRSLGPGLDILAYVGCTRDWESSLLIGEALLRSERDVDRFGEFGGGVGLPLLEPNWPGDEHTGRPRSPSELANGPEQGVLRFLSAIWEGGKGGHAFPFSCIDQESFTRPAEAPPPGTGYYACDGQIANVDTVPATIDLTNIVIGCEYLPPGTVEPGCPADPVAPAYFEVLWGPTGASGPILTLAPGESANVVLWYALPGGNPPLDLYYVELDRLVYVGPTFFTEGTGSRPRVRIGR